MVTLQAWPFLVSRNQTVDYQPVVAPRFMVDNGIAELLVSKTNGERTSEPINLKVRQTKAGDLTLIYRITLARDGQTSYKDGFGRSIDWVEGVVLNGLRDETAAPEVLLAAHQCVEGKFKRFWGLQDKAQMICEGPFEVTVEGQTLVLGNAGTDQRKQPTRPKDGPSMLTPLLIFAVATLFFAFIVASLTAAYFAHENRSLTETINEVCQQEKAEEWIAEIEGLHCGRPAGNPGSPDH